MTCLSDKNGSDEGMQGSGLDEDRRQQLLPTRSHLCPRPFSFVLPPFWLTLREACMIPLKYGTRVAKLLLGEGCDPRAARAARQAPQAAYVQLLRAAAIRAGTLKKRRGYRHRDGAVVAPELGEGVVRGRVVLVSC